MHVVYRKPLLDKLGIKPGAKVAVLGVTGASFLSKLRARVGRVNTRAARNVDVVFLGVETPGDLRHLKPLAGTIKPDGAIWVVAPRGSRVVREADVLAAGKPAGLVDVKVVAFSPTHTAHKFVIPLAKRRR